MIYKKREDGEEPVAAEILNEFNKTPELIDKAAAVFYNQEVYSDREATAKELTKNILINKIEQEMLESKDDNVRMQELIQEKLKISRENKLWD